MGEKDEMLTTIADEIKGTAKAVEEFVDKVAAPEEPAVLIPDTETPPPKLAAGQG